MNHHRDNLLTIYKAALAAVHGRRCVAEWLQQYPQVGSCYVLAIGKAAAAMATGALDALGDQLDGMLVITRHGYADPVLATDKRIIQLEAGHPVPDQASLDAGQTVLDFIAAAPVSSPVLFLFSGGASALAEVLPAGMTLVDLQRVNRWLLGSGLPIDIMNAIRISLSAIKGGGLARYIQYCRGGPDHQVLRKDRVLLLSDVPGDDPAIIGSGLLYPYHGDLSDVIPAVPDWLQALLVRLQRRSVATGSEWMATALKDDFITHHIIANADHARQAAAQQARQSGYDVVEHRQRVTGDIQRLAEQFVTTMADARPALHIWSGEPTVILPERPGNGGRCQSLALALALNQFRRHKQQDYLFLAAGTDGSDGPGTVAGALVDRLTLSRLTAADHDPQQCLLRADAGSCLGASNDLLVTGPTGTNVMDIMLGLRLS